MELCFGALSTVGAGEKFFDGRVRFVVTPFFILVGTGDDCNLSNDITIKLYT